MTDLLRDAIKMSENDEDINIVDQVLVDWLDDKVEAMNKIKEAVEASPKGCFMGTIVGGDYEVSVETCGWGNVYRPEVHIFQGIKHLADAVGEEVTHEEYLSCGKDVYYFSYRGIKFFELCDPGEEAR